MKTKIETLWEILETDASFQTGILLRRYSAEVKPDLYVAIQNAEKLRCLAFRISSHLNTNLIKADSLREIQIEVMPDDYRKDSKLLLFVLLEPRHSDIFAILCEDLIVAVTDISEENMLLKVLAQRFLKWQALFEKLAQNGLSENEQKGLFGELYFLHELLQSNDNHYFTIQTWVGMLGQPQDFCYQKYWAVEVKTTTIGKGILTISNEYQLNDKEFENLFLYYLGIESGSKEGMKLPELVAIIEQKIEYDKRVLNIFHQKLLEIGYFEYHKDYYAKTNYHIQVKQPYHVRADFPRITPSLLYSGVNKVSYDIDLAVCQSFITTIEQLLKTINTYE